jgi:POT family proton-dependent oligopeptide transporter
MYYLIMELRGNGRALSPEEQCCFRRGSRATANGPAPLATYILLLSVIAIVVIFRASYEQSGNTVALWADTGVDRHVMEPPEPTAWRGCPLLSCLGP